MIDTHMIDKGGEAGDILRRLSDEGWVKFDLADTGIVEINEASDKQKRADLIEQAATHAVSLGPMVLDSSMLGLCVVASEEDVLRIPFVHSLIWRTSYEDDGRAHAIGNKSAKARVRDTLHVANAVRYNYEVFITNDRRVLSASNRVRKAFPTLRIMAPRDAVLWLGQEIALHRKRWDVRGYLPVLPSWPDHGAVSQWNELTD